MLDRVGVYEPRRGMLDVYDEPPSPPSRIGRLSGRLLRHPVRNGGAAVLAVGAALIVANAVFFQTSEHPSPLFSTRPDAAATPVAAAVPADPIPIPRVRALAPEAPAPEAGPRRVALSPGPRATIETAPMAPTTVSEVQTALQTAGLYQGRVDGLFGARTRAAIEAYQRGNDLAVTGTVNDALLAHLRTAIPPAVGAEITAAIGETAEVRQIRLVQAALNRIGYGPVRADGEANPATADAITRFQLDNGLSVTGVTDAALVEKMVAIGAMDPL